MKLTWRHSLWAASVLVFVSFSGCRNGESPSPAGNRFTTSTSSSKPKAIVFVHGIYGDANGTWTSQDGKTYWPDLIGNDPQFADADVVVKSYRTTFLGNSSNVQTIAASLGQELSSVFADHREVIFLCHSLGGLIVKQMLLDKPSYAAKVPFIVFYATPGAGSFVARFASVFSDDPLLHAMSDAGDNQYLLDLENRWRGSNVHAHRYCAYEKLKMRPHDLRSVLVGGSAGASEKLLDFVGGIYVVDPYSATYGCDSSAEFTGINATHVGIVKPSSTSDNAYALFAKYYSSSGTQEQVTAQTLRFDNVVCAFYGEASQGSNAWNHDETCVIPDVANLDSQFHQGDFICCGGGATSTMNNSSIPAGLEVRVDGGHYWSVDRGLLTGNIYHLHTYCGPEPAPGPGCNVKVKVVAHYAVKSSTGRPVQ